MPAPRILIADDDADLTGILAQRLEAEGWSVEQAAEGAEALQKLEVRPFALALLDVNMPGLTGLEVCAKARQSVWGRTMPILIMTSDNAPATVEEARRAGATSYILKPPRYEELRAEVMRHLGLPVGDAPRRAAASGISPKLDQLLEKVNKLPAMPMITQKLIEVLNTPTAGARELAKVIALDAAVTAQVLRLANSAYYGQSGKVSDITKAVILIGFSEISHTLMALSLASLFEAKDPSKEVLDRKAFWEHALGVSVMASHLAKHARIEEPSRALVAGLLHDLGKLIVDFHMPEDCRAILDRAAAERRPMREIEREVLGDTHALLGEALAKRWKLPPEIGRCIRYHHVPMAVENLDQATVSLVRVVSAADALCKAAGLGSSGDDLLEELPRRIWHLLAVDQKAAGACVDMGRRAVEVHKASLGIPGRAKRGEGKPAGVPVLHLHEGDRPVALTPFALQALGCDPALARSWTDALQHIEERPGTRAAVLDTESGPGGSRLLDLALKWRHTAPEVGVLVVASGKTVSALPAEPLLKGCPRPVGMGALRQALAAVAP